ncbi:Putative protein [Zobellia galactanivorans]|uniref:Uncharacterized protein n=1 Tax=Zobellia galactanivorans (strain DSM 12802 / CCUG 47099 / CIP 106680 / NCIMB 13871 / Dsij) TaxID=63186 RepID=G0L091_ZOBGA|nr:Putative protein [Zobellia galactanivorans]
MVLVYRGNLSISHFIFLKKNILNHYFFGFHEAWKRKTARRKRRLLESRSSCGNSSGSKLWTTLI